MKRMIFLTLIVLFSILAVASEKLFVYEPVKFDYASAVKIESWYWCRTKGARIEWTWNPVHNIPNVFYVEYTLLQTNKANGGSGFDSQIKAVLMVEEVKRERKIIGYTLGSVTHYDPNSLIPIYKIVEKKYYKKIAESVLEMVNTFKPTYKENSQGAGYEAHGYVKFEVPKVYLNSLRQHQFKIIIYWPPLDNKYHFAASPILVFKK